MDGSHGFIAANARPSPLTHSGPSSAGTKRKRDDRSAPKFYAVRVGRTPGIYYTWPDCLQQVRGFPKAAFKSFHSLTDAHAFLEDEVAGAAAASGKAAGSGLQGNKWYGVKCGRRPGVYSTWPEVLEQITGWKNPRHRCFKTRDEAEAFVTEEDTPSHAAAVPSIENSDPTAKKVKTSKSKKTGVKEERSPDPYLEQGEYTPGEGPLPEGAEDNFDPTIILDHTLGTARYKTAAELARTKYQAVAPVPDAAIKIYTDGSALGNGRAGAVAGVGVYFGPRDRRNISEPLTGTRQTNQRAELTALHRALEVAPRNRRVVVVSDSHYAINCVTLWFHAWRRNGWLNAAGKPVENKDLVVKIVDALEERQRLNAPRAERAAPGEDAAAWALNGFGPADLGHWAKGPGGVHFQWVKGHAKDAGNNAADMLAVQGATLAKELSGDVVLD